MFAKQGVGRFEGENLAPRKGGGGVALRYVCTTFVGKRVKKTAIWSHQLISKSAGVYDAKTISSNILPEKCLNFNNLIFQRQRRAYILALLALPPIAITLTAVSPRMSAEAIINILKYGSSAPKRNPHRTRVRRRREKPEFVFRLRFLAAAEERREESILLLLLSPRFNLNKHDFLP